MRFTLRQLSIFEAVARHMSYTRAAEELHLTQPAVFAQMKQLEDVAGSLLLERVGKRLFLTEVGRELLSTGREILGASERLEMRLADLQGLKRGRLRVAMVTTAKYLIPGSRNAQRGQLASLLSEWRPMPDAKQIAETICRGRPETGRILTT